MNYTLKELLDVPKLQELLDALDEGHSLPSAIIDIEGNVLTATAWQDICTKFHRVNPNTEKKCIESDKHIEASLVAKTPHIIYRCPLGLVDAATPIIVEGRHLGNVFTGQLFMEPPDELYFKEQGRQYGFDEIEYLTAMRKVPLFSEEQLHKNLTFIAKLAQNLAEQVLISKRLLEEIGERIRVERFLKDIITKNPMSIQILDKEGLTLEVNPSYKLLFGSVPPLDYSIFNDVQLEQQGMGGLFDQLRKGEVIFFPDVYFNARDSVSGLPDVSVWVRAIGFPLNDSNGKPEKFVLMHENITERKQVEAELRNSKEHYRAIVDAYDGMIYICSQDYKILYLNEKMSEHIGRSAVGEPCFKALHDLDDVCSWCVNERVFNGEVVKWEVQSPKDNRWYYVVNTPIYKEDGTISKQAMIQDITERKQIEIDRIKLENQLHQAQKMESIGSLAGGVAHDFNNKLSVILGHTYLALNDSDPAQLNDSLEQIRLAAEQSADLTRQLLAFARKQTIDRKILSLNETVSGMLKMLQRLIGEDIRLTWQPSADLWSLMFDPSQLDQILANLCINARDSITDGGNITIKTENCILDEHDCFVPGEYEYVMLSVSDNGCGMDEETRNRIFEPFFTTKGVGKGTGLGLATVFGIVKQNNGFIYVNSESGTGTTFTIHLPRYAGGSERSQNDSDAKSPPRGLETILLLEDELAILDMAAMILKKQGYTVLKANSVTEAIRFSTEHVGKISLLITDVIMPEMNGKELACALQSQNPQLKCIFMSGYTADVIAQHGVLDKGVNFIQKPFSLPDLATMVRNVLDGQS